MTKKKLTRLERSLQKKIDKYLSLEDKFFAFSLNKFQSKLLFDLLMIAP